MKKSKSLNSGTEKEKSSIDLAKEQYLKMLDTSITKIDPKLAQFVICSAMSLNTGKVLNNFSLCCYVEELKEKKSTFSDSSVMTIIDGILGSNIVYN